MPDRAGILGRKRIDVCIAQTGRPAQHALDARRDVCVLRVRQERGADGVSEGDAVVCVRQVVEADERFVVWLCRAQCNRSFGLRVHQESDESHIRAVVGQLRAWRPHQAVVDEFVAGDGGAAQVGLHVRCEGGELGRGFEVRQFEEAAPEDGVLEGEGAGLVFFPERRGVGHEGGGGFEGVAVVEGGVDFDAHEGEDVVLEVLADAGKVDFDWDVQGAEVGGGTDAVEEEEFGSVDGAGGEDDFVCAGCWGWISTFAFQNEERRAGRTYLVDHLL